ncbi:putative DNA sulfur modification protein DndD [Helicobacter cinaedi PAGU611]|uniref:AAA family ATPase n=1 Tax=Helicobacter cinaedi TaxID=213 RepID=UPI00025D3674|nr:AAA family ATPase [Helicobacter cinaedi]BAM13170.1 putative DNA sulfur modification protein DndD [Helicobacter cinaedi PAGU611]BBB21096.1 DNA sulfur modification protein DndD [Helicobacter cinaedi]
MFIEEVSICNLFAYYGKVSVAFRQISDKNLYCLYGNNGFGKTSFIRCAKLLFLGTGLNEGKAPYLISQFWKEKRLSPKPLILGTQGFSGILNKYAKSEGQSEYYVAFSGSFQGKRFYIERRFVNVLINDVQEILTLKLDDMVYKNDEAQDKLATILPPLFVEFFFFDGEEIGSISGNIRTGLREKMEVILQITPIKILLEQMQKTRKELIENEEKNEQNKEQLDSNARKLDDAQKDLEVTEKHIHTLSTKIQELQENIEQAQTTLHTLIANTDSERKLHISSKDNAENNLAKTKNNLKESLKYVVSTANSDLIQSLQQHMQTLQESVRNDDIGGFDKIVKMTGGEILKNIIANDTMVKESQREIVYRLTLNLLNKMKEAATTHNLPKSYIPYNRIHNIETSITYTKHTTLIKDIYEAKDLKKEIKAIVDILNELNIDEDKKIQQESLQEEIKAYKEELAQKNKELIEKQQIRLELNNKIESLEKEKSLLYARINTERINKKLKVLESLQHIITEYKEQLIETLREELCRGIKESYKTLLPNDNVVSVEMGQDFDITLKDVDGNEISVANQSSGQKQILAIAIFWTLSKLSHSTIPLIIDTPLARIDATNRQRIIQNYYAKGHQVIVLPHNGEMGLKEYEYAKPYIAGLYKIDNSEDRGHAKIKSVQDSSELF